MRKTLKNCGFLFWTTIKMCLSTVFASPNILARGFTFSLSAAFSDIRTTAPAPSFSVLALAAVMVPEMNGNVRASKLMNILHTFNPRRNCSFETFDREF